MPFDFSFSAENRFREMQALAVTVLRSAEDNGYCQGTNRMKMAKGVKPGYMHCAFGVLAEEAGIEIENQPGIFATGGPVKQIANHYCLFGFDAAILLWNDEKGLSYTEIADRIEEKLAGLWETGRFMEYVRVVVPWEMERVNTC